MIKIPHRTDTVRVLYDYARISNNIVLRDLDSRRGLSLNIITRPTGFVVKRKRKIQMICAGQDEPRFLRLDDRDYLDPAVMCYEIRVFSSASDRCRPV